MTISGDGDGEGIPLSFLLPLFPGDTWYSADGWLAEDDDLAAAWGLAVRDHLPKVVESAGRLRAAGWALRPSIAGIACIPPDGWEIDDHAEGEPDPAEEYFRSLGLPVLPVDCGGPPRGLAEIMEAGSEAMDRVWYERSTRRMIEVPQEGRSPTPPEIQAGAMLSQLKIESQYGRKSLRVRGNFDRGMLNGKLSALRWVAGEPWDSLYT